MKKAASAQAQPLKLKVAVFNIDIAPLRAKAGGEIFGGGYGAVHTAGAADCHHQIAFAGAVIQRQNKGDKIVKAVAELVNLGKLVEIQLNFRLGSGVGAQLFNIIGVGKKAGAVYGKGSDR